MPRPARSVTGTAAAALTVAAIGLFTAAPSAYAGELGPLEIPPAAAAPGDTVGTAASGSDTKATGHANSLEAGVFTLTPATEREALADTFRVPERTGAGKVTGQDDGKDTGQDSASGDEPGTGPNAPSLDDLAARGESLIGNANPFGLGTSTGQSDTPPGRGTGNGNGNGGRDTGNGNGNGNGNGGRDTGSGNGDGYNSPTGPSGHVKTGVGGSVRPDTTQIAAGVGVLAASAVGGAWLLRRRASGTQAGS
ncbi:hypothetical protein ABZV67_22165 [Streptomyces sp. NPDC005065]|uniref:hypothetical protein n=1 Tax=Streptomyces sp. NPDC005065 TaxID=3154461 RepID=UPI0033A7FEFF